jgi:signal transduction histidine kinase
MQERGTDGLNEDQYRWLNTIHAQGEKAQRMIASLVEFSNLLSTNTQVDKLDLNRTFAQVCADPDDSIQVDHLPTVLGNARHWHQMFSELLANARQFKCPDRPLEIHLFHEVTAKHCVIKFEDNGIGIPEGSVDTVLLPYAKVDFQSDSDGMGLAYCQLIANRHGGFISLSPSAREGLTVSVILPLSIIQAQENS